MLLFVLQMYVSGTGTVGNVQILSAGFITFTKYIGQFCNTVPSVSLFKVPNDESPAVYVHKVTSIMVRNNLHLFANKHVVCLTWVFTTLIILAGILSYINYFIFTFDLYHFSIIFSNTKMINNTKLKTEKIDTQSHFGVMQGSVICTLMYTN